MSKERLVELIINAYLGFKTVDDMADYLLANGVIVPPCKVGDTVYRIYTQSWIGEDKVCEFVLRSDSLWYIDDKQRETPCYRFGKTVFLTREEAEAKLKEMSHT